MMHGWKIIFELTDRSVLGSDGLSAAEPKKKARAVLRSTEDGTFAVIHERKTNLYMLPGGGIEDGEEPETAIRREIFEETGCACDTLVPLGIVIENRFHTNTTRLSYFFAAETKKAQNSPRFTEQERQLDTEVLWCSFDEMLHLIKATVYETPDKRFLQARDLAVLHEYCSLLQKEQGR